MMKNCRYKLLNPETKEVLIAVGDDVEFFESMGYTDIGDVEKAYDGKHYLHGYAPQKPQDMIDAEELARAKAERADAVSRITVKVDGMAFDGDEAAQSRMARAIQAAEASGLTQAKWVLANNEVAVVTVDQIKKALSQAVITMGDLWTVPYEKPSDNIGLAKVGI